MVCCRAIALVELVYCLGGVKGPRAVVTLSSTQIVQDSVASLPNHTIQPGPRGAPGRSPQSCSWGHLVDTPMRDSVGPFRVPLCQVVRMLM